MKNTQFNSAKLAATAMLFVSVWSCSKENVKPPVQSAGTEDDIMSTALLPGEIITDQVTPGTYVIRRFIDTGDDETAQFNGYTFEFQADNDLIARTNTGAVFTGRWSVNSAETRMNIVIGGNQALEDLDDDDWRIDRLTNRRIRISAPDPDIVVFVRQ